MVIDRKQAEVQGFIVDTHCYPWLAYKGDRFAPTEHMDCLTDLEAKLLAQLRKYVVHENDDCWHNELMICELCGAEWNNGRRQNEPATPEVHNPGCFFKQYRRHIHPNIARRKSRRRKW